MIRIATCLMLALFLRPECLFSQTLTSRATIPELDDLAKKYSIQVVVSDLKMPVKATYGVLQGTEATEKELREYAPLFVFEFGLYPPDLIQRSKLHRVVLCKGLSFESQLRNAIPDFENATLYLDVSRGSYSKNYLRKVIHHEFYHIIDLYDDGQLYQDERWAALNLRGFKYGAGGRNAQGDGTTSVLADKFPGFLNHYSTTGVEEDKAEIFANLMVDPERVEVRANKDAVIRLKADRMQALVSDFCPAVDNKFWTTIRGTKRPAD